MPRAERHPRGSGSARRTYYCRRSLLSPGRRRDSLMVSGTETGSDPPRRLARGTEPREQARSKLFLRLFLKNQRRIYAYVLTLLPNRADADDVLQEASLVMWDKFHPETPPDDFAAWGCRIAYFKVLDFFKKGHRARVRFSQSMLERVAETAIEQAGV